MTTKTEFTQEEWEALQKGLTGAGFLMAVSDRSFFDSFKEAGALALGRAAVCRREHHPLAVGRHPGDVDSLVDAGANQDGMLRRRAGGG